MILDRKHVCVGGDGGAGGVGLRQEQPRPRRHSDVRHPQPLARRCRKNATSTNYKITNYTQYKLFCNHSRIIFYLSDLFSFLFFPFCLSYFFVGFIMSFYFPCYFFFDSLLEVNIYHFCRFPLELAKKYNQPNQISSLLAKYAQHLLDEDKTFQVGAHKKLFGSP